MENAFNRGRLSAFTYELDLTEIGEIVLSCWHEILNHFPDIQLGPFVVMPDHIHIQIEIS